MIISGHYFSKYMSIYTAIQTTPQPSGELQLEYTYLASIEWQRSLFHVAYLHTILFQSYFTLCDVVWLVLSAAATSLCKNTRRARWDAHAQITSSVKMSDYYRCEVCCLATRDIVQTECGKHICKECLDLFLSLRPALCPLDEQTITEWVNTCQSADIQCGFSGCKWVGKFGQLHVHYAECEFAEVQCPMCENQVQRGTLHSHQKTSCPMRPELCVHCGKDVPFQQMEGHLAKFCPEVPRPCPNKCLLKELVRHLSTSEGDCPLSTVECPYSIFNCTFVGLRHTWHSPQSTTLRFSCSRPSMW